MKNPLFQQPYQKRAIRGGTYRWPHSSSRARSRVGNFSKFNYPDTSFRLFQSDEKSLEQEKQQRLEERAARRKRRRERLGI